MYMEMPGMGDAVNDPEYEKKLEQLAEKKHLGKERASGYVCKKYEYVYHDKSIGTLTQWFSEKLNYPIKTEMKGQPGGTDMLTEYKNIKEKRLPDSLFEIPPGYTKMSIPGMPTPKSLLLKEPLEPRTLVPRKFEQKLPLMAPARDMPDVLG